EPDEVAVELDLGPATAGLARVERVAGPGDQLVEVPVVAGGDERGQHGRVEQPVRAGRGLERGREEPCEGWGDPRPPSGAGVHAGELAVPAESGEPEVLPREDRLDGSGGALERLGRAPGVGDQRDRRPHRAERVAAGSVHHGCDPLVVVVGGAATAPPLEPELTYRIWGAAGLATSCTITRRVIRRTMITGRSFGVCAAWAAGFGESPSAAQGEKKASPPATHAQTRRARLDSRVLRARGSVIAAVLLAAVVLVPVLGLVTRRDRDHLHGGRGRVLGLSVDRDRARDRLHDRPGGVRGLGLRRRPARHARG